MKHLYSLVFVLIALTISHLSSAQIVYSLPASSPSTCDGSVHFYDNANYDLAYWTWTWYEDSTTVIATGDSVVSNLCSGLYSLVLDSAGTTLTVSVTVTDPCSSNFTVSTSVTDASGPGYNDGMIQAAASGGNPPYQYAINGSPFQVSGTITGLFTGTYQIECIDLFGCSATVYATVLDPSITPIIPNLTFINTTLSCSGYATVSPTGGVSPYSYLWSNDSTTSSINNLCPGNYSVIITDAVGVSIMANCTITNTCLSLTASTSVTNATAPASCDGILQITASGGTPPYMYAIDGGATFVTANAFPALCSGSYPVVVMDSNGCLSSQSVSLSDSIIPVNLAANLTSTNALNGNCSGSASVSPTGGSGGYTYLWSSGQTTSSVSNLCAGTYTVLITDSNLDTVTASCVITDPCSSNFAISASVTNATAPASCDGMIQMTVNGGSGPYVFSASGFPQQSSPTITGLCAGTYAITCADMLGCLASVNATVLDPSLQTPIIPNLTSGNDSTGSCIGYAAVSPTGGSGSYSYLWSNGATTPSITNLCAGTYTVTIWDVLGTDTVTVNCTIENGCSGLTGSFISTPTINGTCTGTISCTASGGTPSYVYAVDGGVTFGTPDTFTALCPGSYTVVVMDLNGCTFSQLVTLSDSSITVNLAANLAATDDLTNNCSGSASVSPSGGIAPYAIEWSNGAIGNTVTNLCAGIYSVTIWDQGVDTITVNFVIADSSSTYTNNPYPNGAINDTLYTDLITNCIIDYNAIDSASLYQAVYNSSSQSLYVTWAVYSPTDTVYISDTLALIGNPGYYALTISVYCPNKSGNDFMKINGVVYFDGTDVYYSTLGVAENLLDNVSIYPNPFTSSISIDNKDGVIQSLKLIDLNGRVLSEMSHLHSGVVEVNALEKLSSGTYLLVLSGESSLKTVKVIK